MRIKHDEITYPNRTRLNSPGLWPKGVSDLLSAGLFVKLSFDIVSPGSPRPRQRSRRAHTALALTSPVPCRAPGTSLLEPPGASWNLSRVSLRLPKLPWSLQESPGASWNLPRASRNRTGRPQNWSPAFFGTTRNFLGPLKTDKFQFFELLAASGSFCEHLGTPRIDSVCPEPNSRLYSWPR